MEGNRLSEALKVVIASTKDATLKRILERVMILDDELNYMDWNDWQNYRNSEDFECDIKEWFKGI